MGTSRLLVGTRHAAGISCVMIFALCAASAAQSPKPAPVDFTGIYRGGGNDAPPGFTVINPYRDQDKLVTAHLQPWAKARQGATEWDLEDSGQTCKLDGIFRNHSGGYEILQVPGKITLISPGIETGGIRRIYLDRPHPRNVRLSWNGDSVGHWEGDTLVVDTIGFNDRSWLFSDREPHTEALHVVERMRLVADGQYLEIIATIEDPFALTAPYTYSRYSKRSTALPQESVCNEDVSGWRRLREKAAGRTTLPK